MDKSGRTFDDEAVLDSEYELVGIEMSSQGPISPSPTY